MAERVEYDEFSMFHENAAEYGIAYAGPRSCAACRSRLTPGQLSALVWGGAPPELCCSTAVARTPTRGTRWRWRSIAR